MVKKDGFLELSEGIQGINFSDSLLTLPLAGSIFFQPDFLLPIHGVLF